MASLGIPLIFAKYVGPGPTPFNFLPVDLCFCWHAGWQDVSLGVRYSLLSGKTGVAPSLSVGVPSNGYNYRGEAVVGRRLRELRLGIDVGRQLDALSPRLSVQGRYAYAIVQRVLQIRNDRSTVAVEPAFLLTRRLSTRAIMTWQRTHGGLRLPDDLTTEERIAQHDRLLRDNSFHIGAGVAYSLRQIDVFGSYIAYARGTNSHAGRALTAGISWPFSVRP